MSEYEPAEVTMLRLCPDEADGFRDYYLWALRQIIKNVRSEQLSTATLASLLAILTAEGATVEPRVEQPGTLRLIPGGIR